MICWDVTSAAGTVAITPGSNQNAPGSRLALATSCLEFITKDGNSLYILLYRGLWSTDKRSFTTLSTTTNTLIYFVCLYIG